MLSMFGKKEIENHGIIQAVAENYVDYYFSPAASEDLVGTFGNIKPAGYSRQGHLEDLLGKSQELSNCLKATRTRVVTKQITFMNGVQASSTSSAALAADAGEKISVFANYEGKSKKQHQLVLQADSLHFIELGSTYNLQQLLLQSEKAISTLKGKKTDKSNTPPLVVITGVLVAQGYRIIKRYTGSKGQTGKAGASILDRIMLKLSCLSSQDSENSFSSDNTGVLAVKGVWIDPDDHEFKGSDYTSADFRKKILGTSRGSNSFSQGSSNETPKAKWKTFSKTEWDADSFWDELEDADQTMEHLIKGESQLNKQQLSSTEDFENTIAKSAITDSSLGLFADGSTTSEIHTDNSSLSKKIKHEENQS